MTVSRCTDRIELVDHVAALVIEAGKERRTKGGYARVVKALWALGLDADGVNRILYYLEYADREGHPCGWLFQKRKTA